MLSFPQDLSPICRELSTPSFSYSRKMPLSCPCTRPSRVPSSSVSARRRATLPTYIVFGTGCYWLIGHPDAGRDDHLPKLKIRDQDGVIVRFRDGPGDMNALWQIYENGMSRTSPYAKWYFIPNEEPKICPDGYNGLPNTNGPGCTLCVKESQECGPVACTLAPPSICPPGDAGCCTNNPCATPCIDDLDKNSAEYLQCTQQTCTVSGPPECSTLVCPNPINGVW